MSLKPQRDLIQGSLDMLVLRTLSRGTLHGYAIAIAIQQRSADELRVEEGALYPALHQLTPAGRKHLAAESANWNRLVAAVARVMEA
jgi:hypothetical protein